MVKKIILPLFFILLLLPACSKPWQNPTVTGYEVTAVVLENIHETGAAMCAAGTIEPEPCAEIKALYNKTRIAFITSGNLLSAAVRTNDQFLQEQNTAAYLVALAEFNKLMPELLELAGTLGIVIGGSQ